MKVISKLAIIAAIAGYTAVSAADSLRVVDQNNQPVANATILLGFEPGNPFPGNVLKTAADGSAGVPGDWKAALPVTVQAAGFITTTLPVMMPGEHMITVSKVDGAVQMEIKGTTTGFGRLITDGKVDFGMVIPAMSRESMLSFDISSVISPQNDTIEIIGNAVDIPSNVTLPNQEETYIFPITLDKPDYRVYVREPGNYQMFVMHGQFPLQRVVNDIRAGKSIFEVINHFTFLEAGQKSVTVTGNIKNVDLSVNQTPFNSTVALKAPAFPADKVMVSLALSEKSGFYVPTDLKRLTPNQAMNLKSNASLGGGSVLSLLLDAPTTTVITRLEQALKDLNPLEKFTRPFAQEDPVAANNYNFNKLSFAFTPATGGTVSPQFLPLVAAPTMSGNVIKVSVPAINAGLTPAAMYMVMSEIETLGTGTVKSERRTRLWEVWSPGWTTQVELPKIAFTKNPKFKYRWEVLFLARPSNFVFEAAPTDRVDLNTVTHVTRNAMDL